VEGNVDGRRICEERDDADGDWRQRQSAAVADGNLAIGGAAEEDGEITSNKEARTRGKRRVRIGEYEDDNDNVTKAEEEEAPIIARTKNNNMSCGDSRPLIDDSSHLNIPSPISSAPYLINAISLLFLKASAVVFRILAKKLCANPQPRFVFPIMFDSVGTVTGIFALGQKFDASPL
jgi:hypothetical protein